MKTYLHSAILKEIEWSLERGLIDGVITNPTLLNSADRKLGDVVNDILETVSTAPVHIQIVSQTVDEMIAEAKTVSKLAKNVVIKIPMTDEGLLAVRELRLKGIKTNITPIFSISQALLAARAGAEYITLFEGIANELGAKEMDIARDIALIFRQNQFSTEIVVSSIEDAAEVEALALQDMPSVAVPEKVLVQMYRTPQTDKGLKKFNDDWDKIPK
ncbi:MAG: fructose-6-phosphate aldolase [Candidatus Kerfeldbacteria bacterium]|nr:fructose-6-phosphate aldolase [Candidatus Kerfeldbacteria bacterium]